MGSDTVVVVGGGPAGLEAARNIGELGGRAVLIEKDDFLGGTPIRENYAALTPHMRSAEEAMGELIGLVRATGAVEELTGSQITACSGEAPDFTLTVTTPQGERTVEAGAIILATGFEHFDPGRETQMYGYYELPDVIALQDLESMLKIHDVVRPSNGLPPERICFIQCVGSRDRQIGNEYCSKVCCGVASKEAIELRQQLPDSKVFIFYIDMRMYGYWENDIYWPAQEKYHVQYIKGIITEILQKGDRLLVRGEDTTMGRPMEVPMDLVVLSVGMEPSHGTREMARLLGVEQNKYGFLNAIGAPLDTVTTSRRGIFAAGASLGPADLEDCASSAGLAAARALASLRRRTLPVG